MAKKRINQKIEKKINNYIAEIKKNNFPIKKVILYGSYAKGKQNKWSDLDICIISAKFKGKIDPIEYLWTKRSAMDAEAMISPVGYHPDDFVDEDPLAYEIKKTGIEVKVK